MAGASRLGAASEASRFGSRDILDSLGVFGEIARSLSGTSEVSEICDRVVGVLKARLGLNTCSIMLIGGDGRTLVNVAGTSPRRRRSGPPAGHQSFRLGEGIAGTVAQRGEAILVGDVNRDARFARADMPVAVRSLLCLPINRGDIPMGVLNLSHADPGFFREDHRTVFGILAAILGKVLSEAQLTQELARFNRDLEAQVAARTREIQASHAYLEQLLSQASDIILTVDWRGRITYVNRRIGDLGYTTEEVQGMPFSSLCEAGSLPPPLVEAMGGKVSQNVEMTLTGVDGVTVQAYCSFCPMEDMDGAGHGALVMVRDVTENKRLELQLRQMEKLTAVGTLVAGIAHEINNKLVPVLVYSEMLQRAELPEKERKLIQTVHKSAMGARHIMESLLRFSRQEPPQKEMHSLNDVVQDVTAMAQYRTKKQDIHLDVRLDGNLPQARMDGHQIAQVVLNLLNNACDAAGDGGHITVTTALTPDRDWLSLTVVDDGPGISKTARARMFDPFFTTKEVGKGTGLGLSLCYGIIQEHGGDIRVESGPGRTCLEVLLPVRRENDFLRPPRSAGGEGEIPEVGGVCLVADGDPTLLDVLEHVLSGRHKVLRESSAKGVMRRLEQGGVDVVMLDCDLDGMEVGQVLSLIEARRPELAERVILMTASVDDLQRETGGSIPAERVVAKPFRLADLQRLVGEVLAGTR